MRAISGIVAAAISLSACRQQPAQPVLDKAWVRLPAVSGNPGAAYFTLKGGSTADALVRVALPAAARAELHETMNHGGVHAMHPLREVPLGVNESVVLEPGGKHVMLFGLNPALRPGAKIALTVTLASGRTLEAPAQLVGPGDPQP